MAGKVERTGDDGRTLSAPPDPPWREVDAVVETRPKAPSPVIGLAVGIAVVAVLVGRGHHLLAGVLLSVVLVVSVGRWVSPGFNRASGRVLHAIAHGAGIALTWIFFVPFTLVVVTPVWFVLRLLRWDPLGVSPKGRGRWARRPRLRGRGFSARLFTDERDESRTWPTRAHGALAGLACCALLAGVTLGAYELSQWSSADGGSAASDTGGGLVPTVPAWQHFETYPWSQTLAEEGGRATPQYDPLLIWRNVDESPGRFLSVDHGARVSYQPRVAAGVEPLQVWFFGGSAAFGYDQRGDHTIASDVVRLAEQDSVPIQMQNFGTVAYTSWQETLLLGELLTERTPPDLIIFYDGMNDLSLYLGDNAPRHPAQLFSNQIGELLAQNDAALSFPVSNGTVLPPGDPASAADIYNRAVELSHRMASSYGVDLMTYYQPSIFTTTGPVDPRVLDVAQTTQADVEYQRARWEEARAQLDPRVVDLGSSVDGVDGTLFYDVVHHNERGASIIAAAMYETLGPRLQQLFAARNG